MKSQSPKWESYFPQLVVLFLAIEGEVSGGSNYNVLMLNPMHSPSHIKALRTVMGELTARGSKVGRGLGQGEKLTY